MRDGYIIPEDCYREIERGAYDGIDLFRLCLGKLLALIEMKLNITEYYLVVF